MEPQDGSPWPERLPVSGRYSVITTSGPDLDLASLYCPPRTNKHAGRVISKPVAAGTKVVAALWWSIVRNCRDSVGRSVRSLAVVFDGKHGDPTYADRAWIRRLGDRSAGDDPIGLLELQTVDPEVHTNWEGGIVDCTFTENCSVRVLDSRKRESTFVTLPIACTGRYPRREPRPRVVNTAGRVADQ